MNKELAIQMNKEAEQTIGNSPDAIAKQLSQENQSAFAVAVQYRALVEAKYVLALKKPRDLEEVRQKMIKECRRPRFAESAKYRKPIGNMVEGPSIRFAEMAIRCMGNIISQTLCVLDDDKKRIIKVIVTDIEQNIEHSVDVTINKTIERKSKKLGDIVLGERLNSKGEKVYVLQSTEDELLIKQNALISKSLRTLGLRLVPGDIVDECMEIVDNVIKNNIQDDPDAKRKIFDSFYEIGVSADDLKSYIGHDSNLSPKELKNLRQIYVAIKDGEATWSEVMSSKDNSDLPQITQSPRQKYETLKLQLTVKNKTDILNDIIKAKTEVTGRQENEFTDEDYIDIINQLSREMANKQK